MNKPTSKRIKDRKLYLCTPRLDNFETFLQSAIEGGVDLVQLRDKSLNDRELIATSTMMQKVCRRYDVPLIINDRPDIALHIDADGVHVGQDDVPVSLCRKILGDDKIIGLSTHCKADFEGSLNENVNYISAGPVVKTPTKPGREGTGMDYIEYVAQNCNIPWFLTGDVNPDTVPNYLLSGAQRFVTVRYMIQSQNPKDDALKLIQMIETQE